MSRLPPLSAVRAFEAAARLENFTAAADELGMTQAAVSYQVKLLESRLGVSLFQRSGRGVLLTEKGRMLAPAIMRAFDDMRAGFAALAAEGAGVLTVSCSYSFANLWLAQRIGSFQMKHPDLAVRLHTSDAWVDFARDGIDMAIRGGMGNWPGLDARLLLRLQLSPMASPAFLAKHGPIRDASDLISLPRLTPEDLWWERWFGEMGINFVTAPRGAVALDSQIMEGRAAIAGQGLAILAPFFWQSEIASGLLEHAMESDVWDANSYWIVCPENTRNLPRIKAFREWMFDQFVQEGMAGSDGLYIPNANRP